MKLQRRQGIFPCRRCVLPQRPAIMASMTGKGHRISAFMVVLATTGSLLGAAAAFLGSTFPDRIEHILWREGRNRHHRRTSHWFVLYLAGFGVCFFLWGDATLPHMRSLLDALAKGTRPVLWSCAAFWFLGGLIHVLCDACCGKVPFLNPRKKTWGWKFFQMSKAHGEMSPGEMIFVGFIAISCLYAWLQRFVL